MITCETPFQLWTVEGKIEVIHRGAGDMASTHVGVDDLSRLLADHVGKWVQVRVEIIDGPRPFLGTISRYPKRPDYPDLPFEVTVVERGPNGDVRHIEVCSRHSIESEARHRAQSYINAGSNHPSGRYTVEIVTPTGMVRP